MIKRGAGTIMVVVLVCALTASPVMAGQISNDITGMTVAFRGHQTEFGTTYCLYDTSVSFTHKGPVHVAAYAQDPAGAGLAGENTDFLGSGSKILRVDLSVPLGQTATFVSTLGKHRGPNFVVLDTFTAPDTQTCT